MQTEDSAEGAALWSPKFNSSHRPIVWGCIMSEDESYVESVTITKETFENDKATNGFTAPEREGYTFKGWAIAKGGSVIFSAADIQKAGVGATLYAVWEIAEPVVE